MMVGRITLVPGGKPQCYGCGINVPLRSANTVRAATQMTTTLAIANSNRANANAGSDAFDIVVTDKLSARRDLATKTLDYIARRTEIDYATYARYRGKLQMK